MQYKENSVLIRFGFCTRYGHLTSLSESVPTSKFVLPLTLQNCTGGESGLLLRIYALFGDCCTPGMLLWIIVATLGTVLTQCDMVWGRGWAGRANW